MRPDLIFVVHAMAAQCMNARRGSCDISQPSAKLYWVECQSWALLKLFLDSNVDALLMGEQEHR